jgi:outer membrane lipoprotein-sorting protein
MYRLLALCLVSAYLAHAQTADEIIAKNIQARGGEQKLKSFSTVRMTGKMSFGSFHLDYVQEVKRPGKVREEQIIQGMAEVDAYDGKTAWRVSPFEGRKDPDLLSEDDRKGLLEDSDIDGQLVDYKNKDHRAEYMGHDSVEGTDCYKIKLTLSTGDVRYYYIDTDSYLELKVETERNIRGTVRYQEILYGDYEQVDGVYFPMAIEMGNKGDANRAKLTIEKVEVNVPLADSLFTIPTTGAPKQ